MKKYLATHKLSNVDIDYAISVPDSWRVFIANHVFAIIIVPDKWRHPTQVPCLPSIDSEEGVILMRPIDHSMPAPSYLEYSKDEGILFVVPVWMEDVAGPVWGYYEAWQLPEEFPISDCESATILATTRHHSERDSILHSVSNLLG